ncbi:hypothetical protein Pd630_LPD11007 (plasmid) [Rhodococcus opacus PD630]|nr:hypothetical protein Pd630_LPD11007 [Rhodococcus opacus PD630]
MTFLVPSTRRSRFGRHTRFDRSIDLTDTFGPGVIRMTQGLSGVGIGPIGRSSGRRSGARGAAGEGNSNRSNCSGALLTLLLPDLAVGIFRWYVVAVE